MIASASFIAAPSVGGASVGEGSYAPLSTPPARDDLRRTLRCHTPAETGWLTGARAASAGRTSVQNRPSCSMVSARRMPGRCGKITSASKPSSDCISSSASRACSGVPTIHDLPPMRSSSVNGPRHERELRDGLAAERQPRRRDRVVLAAIGEALVRGRGLEDLHLLLEHVAIVRVVGVAVVADIDPEHVRLALLGAAAEAAQEPP